MERDATRRAAAPSLSRVSRVRRGLGRLVLAGVMLSLVLSLGARRASAAGRVRLGDALDDQAYLDQLNLTLADVQANLANVQYYLPLGSLNDSYDPTWQLVQDSAQALASDADQIQSLSPPDALAPAQDSLMRSIQQASESAGAAVDAFQAGDTSTADQALISLNDASSALLRARASLPGAPSAQAAVPLAAPSPSSSLQTGDGSSALAPAALAAPVNVGPGWQVRVTGVNFDAWPQIEQTDAFNTPPAQGYRMVLVQLDVSNDGTGPDRLRYSDFALTGASGQLYLPFATDSSCGDVPEQLDASVPPGGVAQGAVCVQTPVGETNLELVSNYHLNASGARYFVLR
jgi:hypothetical protein